MLLVQKNGRLASASLVLRPVRGVAFGLDDAMPGVSRAVAFLQGREACVSAMGVRANRRADSTRCSMNRVHFHDFAHAEFLRKEAIRIAKRVPVWRTAEHHCRIVYCNFADVISYEDLISWVGTRLS